MNSYGKKGHPVLGIVLGILGLAAALLLPFLTGVIGGAIGVILGAAGLLLGLSSRRGGKGMGAVVFGALAIVLSLTMTVSSVNTVKALHKRAEESGKAPILTKHADNPWLGMFGVVMSAAEDKEIDIDNLNEELKLLQ